MKIIRLQKILVVCLLGSIQVIATSSVNSLVVSPKIGSTIKTNTPIITGIMKNNKQKPIKNKPVTVYVDNRKVATVKTNHLGVWSYKLKSTQKLNAGAHSVQASVPACLTPSFARGTLFYVQTIAATENVHKSGNVSVSNSEIIYPFTDSYINDSIPTIIGSLLDADFNPVSGETVVLKIDDVPVASPTSDSNGIIAYTVATPLSDGSHTLEAHCVESSVDLTTIDFTVDTTDPDAPIILLPTENATIDTSLVTISGTSQTLATVITFMDGNTYGDICYADESGNWSNDYTLDNGAHNVAAQATDLAGNVSPLSQVRSFTVWENMS